MSIDFRLRDFFYPTAILRLKREFDRNQWAPPGEIAAYQATRLRAIVQHAYSTVPYYRESFDRSGVKPADIQEPGDLARLPSLPKSALAHCGKELLSSNAGRYHPILYRTSGTSGTPLSIYLDKGANALEFVYYWRHWSWAGYRLGDRFAELGSQYFLQRERLAESKCAWQAPFRRLMINSHSISVAAVPEIAAAFRKHRPRFLKGMASPLYYLALTFQEAGVTDISLSGIFSTGEILLPRYRSTIQKVFGCPVMDSYGHMERTVAISQCPKGGYHVNSDYGLLEFEGRRDSEEGARALAIGTSLHNFAMPLLRYEVGDEIELLSDPRACPCGRTFPLVRGIRGRAQDIIVTPDGRFVTSIFIVPEFVNGIIDVQFVQESRDRLLIRVLPDAGFDDTQRDRLLSLTEKVVGSEMKIKLECVGDTSLLRDPTGKKRPVISTVPAPLG